jgi:beta-galactosidase
LDFPPFGNVIDYLTYSGIYREVSLNIRNKIHFIDYQLFGQNLLFTPKAFFSYELSNAFSGKLEFCIKDEKTEIIKHIFSIHHTKDTLSFDLNEIILWDIENPKLYHIFAKLIINGEIIDEVSFDYGFREAHFKPEGFYLNGKKIKLLGLNRHQDYPYVGYAMPKSAQVHDAHLLKHELNLNIVRTSHYPQSKHFIEACDRLGLLVFEEIPGWQHIGDDAWKAVALANVKEMIHRDKNNPSVILWGVRINESGDDDSFYEKTNQIAKSIDPTRQTAGVRFITHSSVQEDVFALNDFIHEGHNVPLRKLSDVTHLKQIPYLVTEHTGHMYPTKSFDSEAKRLEHTKRHMRIAQHMLEDSEISGAIGWCMHDYNTHVDFGSGDKICYHGVLDLFRNTKMAAYFYQSQTDLKPFLETSSHFNIGEYPKGFIPEAYVFTNCDEVHLYRNEAFIGKLKKDEHFSNLKNPPFMMDWLGDALINYEGLSKETSNLIKKIYPLIVMFGENNLPDDMKSTVSKHEIKLAWQMYGKYIANWGSKSVSYTFKGLINNQEVISKTKGNDFSFIINVHADSNHLIIGKTYDVTRITVEAKNEHDHRLTFASNAFLIETDDLLEVIGDQNVSLIGGIRSFWVKTRQLTGQSKITIIHQNQRYLINIEISKEAF